MRIANNLEGITTWKLTAWKEEQLGSQQFGRENNLEANSFEGRTTWKPTAWKGELFHSKNHPSDWRLRNPGSDVTKEQNKPFLSFQ
nr:hypothetical protein Iba_chr05aCG12170 [Ipomoea batatas]